MLSAKQIAPGQTGEIEVSVKTEGLSSVHKTITVTSNARPPEAVLSLSAIVEREFALSEPSIYFGNLPRGKEVVKEVAITITTERDVRLLGAECTDDRVSIKLETVPGTNNKKMRVIATRKADAREGYHFGYIVIKTTSSHTPELKISVRGTVIPPQSN